MSRGYEVHLGGLLDFIVDGKVIGTLPFSSTAEADAFGREFVLRDVERQAAMERHPAGKRRLSE